MLGALKRWGSIDPAIAGGRRRRAGVDPEMARAQGALARSVTGTGFNVVLPPLLAALRRSYRGAHGQAAHVSTLPLLAADLGKTGSRGNGWTIMGILFVIFFAAASATMTSALVSLGIMRAIGAESAAAVVVWTIAILVSYAGAAIAATAQSLIFRTLSGWQDSPVALPR